LKKTEKTLSIPKSKKIKIFFIAALPQGHNQFIDISVKIKKAEASCTKK